MPVQLLPMPQSEWGLYYDVSAPAFYPGSTSLLFPDGISDQAQKMLVAGMKREANRYPGRRNVFKVVDTDLPDDDPFQKIVGVSLWKVFDKERTDEDMEQEKEESELRRFFALLIAKNDPSKTLTSPVGEVSGMDIARHVESHM